ncbi:MAG TPA: cytochrome c, partial [Bradyrhizobium sp.]|nr:cytochrome c [Bradyrhizobium sp.]
MRLGWGHDDGAFFFSRPDAAQQDLIKQTQTVMKGNGKNAGALGAIVKGEKPYDQATVDAALAQFEDTVKKLPTL